jgi:hypothetical protein
MCLAVKVRSRSLGFTQGSLILSIRAIPAGEEHLGEEPITFDKLTLEGVKQPSRRG